MPYDEYDFKRSARARTALSLKLAGIVSEVMSEMSSATGKIARNASGENEEINLDNLRDPGADWTAINMVQKLEDLGVKLDYQTLAKMDRGEAIEEIRNIAEQHDACESEETFEVDEG